MPTHIVRRLPFGSDFCERLSAPAFVAFFDEPEAREDVARRERAARSEERNPFRAFCPLLAPLTSLAPELFHDWLLDAGVVPPEEGEQWEAWWDRCAGGWDELQTDHIWRGLDLARFFDVVEGKETGWAYVAVEIGYVEAESGDFLADAEGGLVPRAFADLASASAYRSTREMDLRADRPETWWAASFDMSQRSGWNATVAPLDATAVPLVEVSCVERVGPLAGLTAYLVQRPGLWYDGVGWGTVLPLSSAPSEQSRVPLALFADRAQAEADCRNRLRWVVEMLSPFAIWEEGFDPYTPPAFREWAQQKGLPPVLLDADSMTENLSGWWWRHAGSLSPAHRQAVWDWTGLTSERPLFQVAAVPVG